MRLSEEIDTKAQRMKSIRKNRDHVERMLLASLNSAQLLMYEEIQDFRERESLLVLDVLKMHKDLRAG